MSARKSDRVLRELKIKAAALYPAMKPAQIAELLDTSIANIQSWVVPGTKERIKARRALGRRTTTGHRTSIRITAARAGLGT